MSEKAPKVNFGGDYKTDQIYSLGYEFAFMGQKRKGGPFHQACPFVYCKNFLHDAIWAFLNKTKVNIYSFKYEHGKDVPLNMDRTVLAFRNTQFKGKEDEFHAMMAPCLEFLQMVDRQLGFRPTQIFQVDHKESPCWLVIGDAGWQHAPTMISLYTLFIRLGCFHKPGDELEKTLERAEKGSIKIGDDSSYAGNHDSNHVKRGRKGIDLILQHGLDIWHEEQKDNYPEKLKDYELHNNYGIVNFTAQRPKSVMPHWYRSEIWGK